MSRILLVARLSQETPGQTGMDTGQDLQWSRNVR